MTSYPEEILSLPGDWTPAVPDLMLLTDGSYTYEFDNLLRAGSTLEEVYNGLVERKWFYGTDMDKWWPSEPPTGFEYNTEDYFPR